MPKTSSIPKALREENARVAQAYDEVLYDPVGAPHVDPLIFRPLAKMFGLNCDPQDVLDIGCGSGGQLARMSSRSTGRLVGVDLSKTHCDLARERFAHAGRNAEFRVADVMDLEPADLGQFDLVACTGTLYVAPEPVRRKMLDLVGQCLRPGGIAIISYYAGLSGQIAADLMRIVRRQALFHSSSPSLPHARGVIEGILKSFELGDTAPEAMERIKYMTGLPDPNLYHEVFGPPLQCLHTTDLQDHLQAHGVGVAGYLPGDTCLILPDSEQRAMGLDVFDAMRGGYHYLLCGKWPGERQSVNFNEPGLLWASTFVPTEDGREHAFHSPETGAEATIRDPVTRAFVTSLVGRALRYGEALEAARRILGPEPINEAGLMADLLHLWNTSALAPILPDLPPKQFANLV